MTFTLCNLQRDDRMLVVVEHDAPAQNFTYHHTTPFGTKPTCAEEF